MFLIEGTNEEFVNSEWERDKWTSATDKQERVQNKGANGLQKGSEIPGGQVIGVFTKK